MVSLNWPVGFSSGRKDIKSHCNYEKTEHLMNRIPNKEGPYQGLLRTSYRSILLGALHGVAGESKKINYRSYSAL